MISAEANNEDGIIQERSIEELSSKGMFSHDIHRRPIRSFDNIIPSEILQAGTERDRDSMK